MLMVLYVCVGDMCVLVMQGFSVCVYILQIIIFLKRLF